MQMADKIIEIDAPVARVFELFSDFEKIPSWMRNISDVYTGRRLTHWIADAPPGPSIEWETEITVFEPDHHLAWRTVRGDLYMEGKAIFQETRRGTTLMRVALGYDLSAGRSGAVVVHLFGENLDQQLEEDLMRFAELAEKSHGRGARRKRFDDEQRVGVRERGGAPVRSEPQIRQQRSSRRDYVEPEARPDVYRDFDERVAGQRRIEDEYRSATYRTGARSAQPDVRRLANRERARFDQELEAVRRSQLERARQYDQDRERDERRRRDREERERHATGMWNNQGGEKLRSKARPLDDSHRSEEDDRPRHALTPRERERERAGQLPDYEATRSSFRRGIDRLMDNPPSTRWRR